MCAKAQDAQYAEHFSFKRPKDNYLLIPLWQKALNAAIHYAAPPANDDLACIQNAGVHLQSLLAKSKEWSEVEENTQTPAQHVPLLKRHAVLEAEDLSCAAPPPWGQPLVRFAAAYHLWPFYAAIYYGYPEYALGWESVPRAHIQKRQSARQMLCNIQKLLFANAGATRDFLRAAFDVLSDSDTTEYLSAEGRARWRPKRLTDFKPDLCAIDSLAMDIIRMQRAAVLMRDATIVAHRVAMALPVTKEELDRPSEALRLLGVAQMTHFYNPRPGLAAESRRDLHELLLRATDEDTARLRLMVPFHLEATGSPKDTLDPISDNFRRLGDAIYSCVPSKKPAFGKHRDSTISVLRSGDHIHDFFSDGATTCLYLKATPGSDFPVQGPYWFQDGWEANFCEDFPDWIDRRWWAALELDQVLTKLFPGRLENLHDNAHASAYWDHLGGDGTFLCSWEEMRNWIASEWRERETAPTSIRHNESPKEWAGFLMEILLRRQELLARTSFFIPLAQAQNDERELDQFVGGTFIGLERPGIPFEEARFKEIVRRMLPLILALGDCCKAVVLRKEEEERKDREHRRTSIFGLIEGSPVGRTGEAKVGEGPPFRFKVWHTYNRDADFQRKIPLLQKLQTWDSHWTIPISDACWETLKALFYIFRIGNPSRREEFEWPDAGESHAANKKSYKGIYCSACLDAMLASLITPPVTKELPKTIVHSKQSRATNEIEFPVLPSKPGVRFLLSLADFLNDAAQGQEDADWLESIELSDRKLVLSWTSNRLINKAYKKITSGRATGTSLRLAEIQEGSVSFDENLVRTEVVRVLQSMYYYSPVTYNPQKNKLVLTW